MRCSSSALILVLILLGSFISAQEPERFEALAADPVDWIDITEDGKWLVLAHKDAEQCTVWDIATNKRVAAFDVPGPACVLCRGTTAYVANFGYGLVTAYDGANDWKQLAQIEVGSPNVAYLSAPGGKAFKGQLLAVCDIEPEKKKQLAYVDIKAKKGKLLGGEQSITIATVDYDGKGYIVQGGLGSPSRSIDSVRSWPHLTTGRDTPLADRRYETLPYLRQVQTGPYWFGGAMICQGLPPIPIGQERLQFVVGDRTKVLGYVIEPGKLTALELKGELKTVGQRKVEFPKSYERFDGKTHINSHQTATYDFQNVGLTKDGKLHLYVYDGRQKLVFAMKTEAFPGDDPREKPDFSGLVKTPTPTKPEPQPTPNRSPSRPTPNAPRPAPNIPAPQPMPTPDPAEPSGESPGVYSLTGDVFALAYGAEGKSLLVLDATSLKVLDPSGLTLKATHAMDDPYRAIAEREKHYAALASDRIDLLRKDTLQVAKSIQLASEPREMAPHPTKPVIYIAYKQAIGAGKNAAQPIVEVDEVSGSVRPLPTVLGTMVACDGKRLFAGRSVVYKDGVEVDPVSGLKLVNKYANLDSLTSFNLSVDPPMQGVEHERPAVNGKRLSISPDGAYVAYIAAVGPPEARPRAVCCFETADFDKAGVRYTIEGFGQQAAFHPTADLIACASQVNVWFYERSSGRALKNRWEPRTFQEIHDVLFTADGKSLLVVHSTKDRGRIAEVMPVHLSEDEQKTLAKGFPGAKPGGRAPAGNRPVAVDEPRIWTDVTGKFKIEAKFGGVSGGQVKLLKTDGTETTVPLNKLSAADQAFVRKAGAK